MLHRKHKSDRPSAHSMPAASLGMESLETRLMLSRSDFGYSPAQIRHAYRVDQIMLPTKRGGTVAGDGSGQTIAIVDAFDDPTAESDLQYFDRTFGLTNTDSKGRFVLTKVWMGRHKPAVNGDWSQEAALDVEWAHAIAPKAHIVLVEAQSDTTDDMLVAINYATHMNGVVAVSMSWGGTETPFVTNYDTYLQTPRGHLDGGGLRGGITFLSSSGDAGAGSSWPAVSPYVTAVGGTVLTLDRSGDWVSETGWSGSGGGPSRFERTYAPDVAYNADPNTGVAVYDSTRGSDGVVGWEVVGGTSAGAPQWAALIAIADQGRNLLGRPALDGPSQTIAALYDIPSTDFHDIVSGNNGLYSCTVGYDLVTGLGSPLADRVVRDLALW